MGCFATEQGRGDGTPTDGVIKASLSLCERTFYILAVKNCINWQMSSLKMMTFTNKISFALGLYLCYTTCL